MEWTVNVTLEETTGIEDMENIDFKLYPNPAVNYINIRSNSIKDDYVEIMIYDLTGKAVKSKGIYLENDLNVTFYFENELNAGIYFVRVKSTDKDVTQRFIIK